MARMEQAAGSDFIALLSRMRYIERWALMRNARTESLSEHSLEVAMIAHLLAVIANVRYGAGIDASHRKDGRYRSQPRRSAGRR